MDFHGSKGSVTNLQKAAPQDVVALESNGALPSTKRLRHDSAGPGAARKQARHHAPCQQRSGRVTAAAPYLDVDPWFERWIQMFDGGAAFQFGSSPPPPAARTPRRQPSETTIAGAEDSQVQDLELVTAAVCNLTLSLRPRADLTLTGRGHTDPGS
jgi:hypothetical protein